MGKILASQQRRRSLITLLIIIGVTGVATAALINMTIEDFHLSGTQVLDVDSTAIFNSGSCTVCHGPYDVDNDPYATWKGSLMGNSGRDPLFFAQMTSANQDIKSAGYFCMRCHLPMSWVTGHANDTDGSTLNQVDKDGITCHLCHSMVDPIYKPGISPIEDEAILAGLDEVPSHYGNGMFVLDPNGTRRGPRTDAQPMHSLIVSPFHREGAFCGTCHDVGNVVVTKQDNGTYRYNALDTATPFEDPHMQFPLQRTYTEWKLSEFALKGVDMGGRFGGAGVTVVNTCQDCHMPRAAAKPCQFTSERPDVARHDFAGATAPILDLIAEFAKDDPDADLDAIARARDKAVSMLQRAATLELEQMQGTMRVRVINQSGHKLPTGHNEGRRVFLTVRFYDADDQLLSEFGHYDMTEAHLDEASTKVYEMLVGLSDDAALYTGYPAGRTPHMVLADTIIKDNRIPPRGFDNATYAAGGAPVVGAEYADGQHWDDSLFRVPNGAVRCEATVNYQCLTREYVDFLQADNFTDHWGDTLKSLYEITGRGAPIEMVKAESTLATFVRGDIDGDGFVGYTDLIQLITNWSRIDSPSDVDGNGVVDVLDLLIVLTHWGDSSAD